MPPSGSLLTLIDNATNNLKKLVDQYQTPYIAGHVNYWQGIFNPPTIPTDGQAIPPILTLKPTDQIEDWTPIGLPSTVPVSGEIVVHNGPGGKGYTIRCWCVVSGDGTYFKSIGVGPGSITTNGWILFQRLAG